MLAVSYEREHYLAQFEPFATQRHADGEPDWLWDIRREAMTRFQASGFPSPRNEEWQYTSVAPIIKTPFRRSERADVSPDEFMSLGISVWDGPLLVFVNGHYCPKLSRLRRQTDGILVQSLQDAIRDCPELVQPRLASPPCEGHAFTDLATAFAADGAFVYLGNKALAPEPIHIVFLTLAGSVPLFCAANNIFVAEESARFTVVETHLSVGGPRRGSLLTNVLTRLEAAKGASISHYRVQREGPDATLVSSLQLAIGRDATVNSSTFTLGGALVRNDVGAILAEQGAVCTLAGLYLGNEKQRIDCRVLVDHQAGHTRSSQGFKGILDDEAQGAFNGKIVVRPETHATDATQTSRNLLLSNRAIAHAKPQLEIHHNDVRCSHGATIGQLDPDAIFYLRSRGIGHQEARRLLTYAFASDVIDQVSVAATREMIRDGVLACLTSFGRNDAERPAPLNASHLVAHKPISEVDA